MVRKSEALLCQELTETVRVGLGEYIGEIENIRHFFFVKKRNCPFSFFEKKDFYNFVKIM